MRNGGVRNCSLPLPVLVNDDLLERSAHVGQFNLLCYVVPRVVLHHSVLLSDSRREDLGSGQDSEVRNQREGLWNPIAQRCGKHGIAVYRRWCALTSVPLQTRVAQNFDEQVCKLKNLENSDFSLFTHVFALDRDESDCKLQYLVRGNLISWLLHVFAHDLDEPECKIAKSGAQWPLFADSRAGPGSE